MSLRCLNQVRNETSLNLQITLTPAGNLAPFLISLSLMVGQQLSGMNAVMFYAVDIFNDAGSGLKSIYANIIIAIVQVYIHNLV